MEGAFLFFDGLRPLQSFSRPSGTLRCAVPIPSVETLGYFRAVPSGRNLPASQRDDMIIARRFNAGKMCRTGSPVPQGRLKSPNHGGPSKKWNAPPNCLCCESDLVGAGGGIYIVRE